MWLSTIKFCHFNFIVNSVFFFFLSFSFSFSLSCCFVRWLLVEKSYFHWMHCMVLSLLLNCHDRIVNFFFSFKPFFFCSHVAACLQRMSIGIFFRHKPIEMHLKNYTWHQYFIFCHFSLFFFCICIDFTPSNFDFLVSVLPNFFLLL